MFRIGLGCVLGMVVSLSVDGLVHDAAGYCCSVAVAAAVARLADDFLRFLMMIVIRGTISRGKMPFSGW